MNATAIGTEQEMLDYPVALKFPDDSGPCSSRAVFPSEVTSQIVDVRCTLPFVFLVV